VVRDITYRVPMTYRAVPVDPVRAGQALFVVQCLPCRKLNGAGASDVGPDLTCSKIRLNISRRRGCMI
jgi:cytochrome c2